jgi:hypothetical protein
MMTVSREKTLPTALRIVRENGGAIRVPRTARSRGARPRGYFFAELPASTADRGQVWRPLVKKATRIPFAAHRPGVVDRDRSLMSALTEFFGFF